MVIILATSVRITIFAHQQKVKLRVSALKGLQTSQLIFFVENDLPDCVYIDCF